MNQNDEQLRQQETQSERRNRDEENENSKNEDEKLRSHSRHIELETSDSRVCANLNLHSIDVYSISCSHRLEQLPTQKHQFERNLERNQFRCL